MNFIFNLNAFSWKAMQPTAPDRVNASVFATTPCSGLSLSRSAAWVLLELGLFRQAGALFGYRLDHSGATCAVSTGTLDDNLTFSDRVYVRRRHSCHNDKPCKIKLSGTAKAGVMTVGYDGRTAKVP